MILRWLEDAVLDLGRIRSYIAQENPAASQKTTKEILNLVQGLCEQPAMGRPGRVPETRELIISGTPYIVAYRVVKGVIEILRIFHSAMEWPENL